MNSFAAIARIRLTWGSWIDPARIVAAPDVRAAHHDPERVLALDLARDVDPVGDERRLDVRADGLTHPPEELARVLQQAALDDPVAEGGDHLLLARLAGEVALARGLADAGVGERVLAVEVVTTGGDVRAIEAVLVVAGSQKERVTVTSTPPTVSMTRVTNPPRLTPRLHVDGRAARRAPPRAPTGRPGARELLGVPWRTTRAH